MRTATESLVVRLRLVESVGRNQRVLFLRRQEDGWQRDGYCFEMILVSSCLGEIELLVLERAQSIDRESSKYGLLLFLFRWWLWMQVPS